MSGLGSETTVVEKKGIGPDGKYFNQKAPGQTKFNDVTLKRGLGSSKEAVSWRRLVEQGQVADARTNCTVTMKTTDGKVAARFNLFNAWPSKITCPNPKADGDEEQIEELVLAVEGYERVE